MDCGFVPRDEIDLRDRTFEIRSYVESADIAGSLRRFGILVPPWVQRSGRGYIVADGFKRLDSSAASGEKAIFCRILSGTIPRRDVWLQRIETKLFGPGLNPAEKARIASVLIELFPSGEVPRQFFDRLRISPRREVLHAWAKLASFGPELLQVIASGDIAERAALELAEWDPESRSTALTVLAELRCSASIQVEIVERINEISLREETGRAEILHCAEAEAILSAGEMNHRQKTQMLRDHLRRLRFPRLREREHRFGEQLEALGLPGSLKILPPPSFEGNGWRLELAFTSAEDLRGGVDAVRTLLNSDGLDSLMAGVSPKTGGRTG
ncbi:MAG: hypothetical protein LLG06_00460 [Desulfobacteraceae bacterium]|nr:hypothetical protein [Desulfobacteraceae bacterium]